MKIIKSLYFWIIFGLLIGVLIGMLNPNFAISLQPLGTAFIKLLKVFIVPIVFLTVALGIAQTGSLKKLGSVGLKAFIYFEVVSTFALLIGWLSASIIKPGSGLHADVTTLDTKPAAHLLLTHEKHSFIDFLQNLIPGNIFEPFIKGDLLQVLLLAIIFGISLLFIEENYSKSIIKIMDNLVHSLFKIIQIIMYAAPIGVLGAMAFTIGKFGGHFLLPLIGLIGTFYLTGLIFVFLVLGFIAKISGFSITRFLRYLSKELLLVLGTSSSESALPQLLKKLQNIGCKKETVGVVVPMGYSFNLDGTNIYITLAALFIAQALGIHLSITEQLLIFFTAMVTSKGAAGITGAGFITLAATLAVVPSIPVVGIVLILGIDRFMSEARSLINFIGNGVAAIVVSRWQNEISAQELNQALNAKMLEEKNNNVVPTV